MEVDLKQECLIALLQHYSIISKGIHRDSKTEMQTTTSKVSEIIN